MKKIHAGQTNNSLCVKLLNPSTQGQGLTGVTVNGSGFTGAVTLTYWREGASTSVPVNLTDASSGYSYSSGQFVEIDSTNMPGVYRIDIPNAAVASGSRRVVFTLRGSRKSTTPNVTFPDADFEIELDAINYQDSDAAGLSGIVAAEKNVIGDGS